MDHAKDDECSPLPNVSLLDEINSEDFMRYLNNIEEDKIDDLGDQADISISNVILDNLLFRTPKEKEYSRGYSTASRSQQNSWMDYAEATIDNSYVENQDSSVLDRTAVVWPDEWADRASTNWSAFFHACTCAPGDKKSYDIGPAQVRGKDYNMAESGKLASPNVSESLVKIELIGVNSKNKKSFQSQMTAAAMMILGNG